MQKLMIVLVVSTLLYSQDAYQRNCVECHKTLPISLQRIFMNYLLVYGGEKNTKVALKYFMRYPRKDTSVLSNLFLENFDVKQPLTISDKELTEAIDIYWEKYKVIGKLK